MAVVAACLAAMLHGAVAAPRSTATCSTRADTDFDGNDLKPVHAQPSGSPDECCQTCATTANCSVWTFIPHGADEHAAPKIDQQTTLPSAGGGGVCFLKYSAAGARPFKGYTSGCVGPCPPPPVKDDFDCRMRSLAVEYARYIQPFRPAAAFSDIADALNGAASSSATCHTAASGGSISEVSFEPRTTKSTSVPSVGRPVALSRFPFKHRARSRSRDTLVIYVATNGSDSNRGTTVDRPLATLGAAVKATRNGRVGPAVIVLRQGTYYPGTTVLNAKDSMLTIEPYQGEEVWLSGGHPLQGLEWTRVTGDSLPPAVRAASPPANIWQATLPLATLPGLRIDSQRLTRARFPNADPERDGFMPPNVFRANWTAQPVTPLPEKQVDLPPTVLLRNTTKTMFQTFTAGLGGTCERFEPAAGYWCSTAVQGGGSTIYQVPIAMQVGVETLPHLPYAHPKGAIVQTWRPGHWASWMYEVGDVTPLPSGGFNFSFASGGFQGSRGAATGEDSYIENIFEELDSPGEWFFNESTRVLYLWHNATEGTPPPTDGSLVAVQTKWLLNVTGTREAPVKDVQLTGLGLRDTAYTYMDPHGIPSGGDWTLERSAVVFAQATEDFSVEGCVFERVDGNAILLSGYNRGASITHNEFAWIGATAVALWGDTETTAGADSVLPEGYGSDGTAGNQPRDTTVAFNLCHELGIWEKQSSFYTQFKAGYSNVSHNIVYNGPRAHLNHNDGVIGGTLHEHNLIFNSCRESGDHGPFNSWDRDPYLITDPTTGKPTTTKAMDVLRRNFIVANYNSLGAVDNDDGSSYYHSMSNFFVYGGGGMKNDFEGHDNYWSDNVIAFPSGYLLHNGYGGTIGTPGHGYTAGHADKFWGNVAIIAKGGSYAKPVCSGPGATVMNTTILYSPDPSSCTTDCGQGFDVGASIRNYTNTMAADIIAEARARLFAWQA